MLEMYTLQHDTVNADLKRELKNNNFDLNIKLQCCYNVKKKKKKNKQTIETDLQH